MPADLLRVYRGLLKRPGFFLAVVLTLALGIGANSAIFSVIDAVLLKPLPYPAGDRLLAVYEVNPRQKVARGWLAPGRLEEWNRMNRNFAGIAGAYTESLAETSGLLPEKLVCARVSPRFFAVLGTPPLAGRGFSPEEDQTNGPWAAVISERFWDRRFQRDPQVAGKLLRAGSRSYTIVGVAPDSVRFPAGDVDVWTPAKLPDVVMRSREARFYIAVGRLKEGVKPAAAQADLSAVEGRLALQYPGTDANWAAFVEPLKEDTVGGVRRSLWILFGAVTLVLLIACANVACLLLAHASHREREIAVRISLGARRVQVVGHLLAEALCAALPGALLGLLVASAGADWFRTAARRLPRADEIRLDWRIVAFTLTITMVTAILCGLFPALSATGRQMSGRLAQGSRTQVSGRGSAIRLLVSAQIALAIVLLVGAGLLIRTLSRLGQTPLGFQPENVLTLKISASWGEKNNMRLVEQRLARTLGALTTVPGVQLSALTVSMPGTGEEYLQPFGIEGRDTVSEGQKTLADLQAVSPDYFRLLGIPMLSGQTCGPDANSKTLSPVLVNRSFVDQFLSAMTPLGRHLTAGTAKMEIVGVVGDVREHGYSKGPKPVIYFCGMPGYYPDPVYMVKTAMNPAQLVETVRRKMQALEPSRAVYDTRPLADWLDASLSEKRFQTRLLSMFGMTALLLAMVGLYGVTSFFVSQRRREIGLRAALGAQPAQILVHVFRQGARMTGLGLVVGLAAAAALTRFIATLLFGIVPLDPVTFAVVPVVLAFVAALAVWVPARRATRVDPLEALRE
ncbi:MAG TPA: ABC transporter permease [Candidatus Acidoferrales bacterium]|jgi:putative ABC transport system permease protein|nr:ABC transporter permease [Candidatus Acidoferrales bacterium]